MRQLRSWIGVSAADAVIRLGVQLLSTVIMARLLPAESFGLALLVLSVASVAGAFIGLPFEESLIQRRRLLTGHLEVALFVSLALSLAAILLSLVLGPALAHLSGKDGLIFWLPVATIFLVGQGPAAICRALARRYRRFVELAVCQALAMTISCFTAIALAVMGEGILALICHRLMPNLILPVLFAISALLRRRSILLVPRWHGARFRELFRFSWLLLADFGVDAATPAIFSFAVNALFGTAVLGHINIAQRMVDPLRSAIEGIGHNLSFSVLTRLQHDPPRALNAASEIVVNVAAVAVPAFLGLAVTAPILLPILVGPGWDAAVPVARLMCLAAAISVPLRHFYSSFAAVGRPEYGLAGTTAGLIAMLVVLGLVDLTGAPQAIGAAYLGNEAVTGLLAIALAIRIGGTTVLGPLGRTLRVWAAGIAMVALLQAGFFTNAPDLRPAVLLMLVVVSGICVYTGLLYLLCRPSFETLARIFLRRGGAV